MSARAAGTADRGRSRAERFVRETLTWLNARHAPPGRVVRADTPLFEDGLIDSMRVLELIAWTEIAIGESIPDVMMRMDNFRSVGRIAEVFLGEASDVDR